MRGDLPPEPDSVPRAADLVRDTCNQWGLGQRADAAAVATELVANAVAHARDCAWSSTAPGSACRFGIGNPERWSRAPRPGVDC